MHTLRRVLVVFRTLVAQVEVLETMTPLQFLSFRSSLEAASGFQSAQFRELEFLLGHKRPAIVRVFAEGSPQRARLERRLHEPSVWSAVLHLLARSGYPVPSAELNQDVTKPAAPSPGVQRLLIEIYQHDIILTQVCERLIDLDEIIQEWRYQHVKMVERTIGAKAGSGGSTGAGYLRATCTSMTAPGRPPGSPRPRRRGGFPGSCSAATPGCWPTASNAPGRCWYRHCSPSRRWRGSRSWRRWTAPVLLILFLAGATAAVGTVYLPASGALIPEMVADSDLAAANGLFGMLENLVVIVGPAIGGLLLLAGRPVSGILFNLATFAAAAVLISRLRLRSTGTAGHDGERLITQVAAGISALRRNPRARTLVAFAALGTAVYGASTVLYSR